MKLKTIVKVSLVTIVVGFVFTGVGYAINGSFSFNNIGSYKLSNFKNTRMISESKELDSFENININADFNDIKIIPSDRYKLEFKYRESEGKVNYKVDKNTLTVEQDHIKRINGYDLNLNEEDRSSIRIYIPKDIKLDNLEVISSVSNVDFRDMDINYLNLSCDVGNIEIKNCKVNKATLLTYTGNIEVHNIEASKVKSYNDVGNIIISNSTIKECLEASNALGNIEIDGKLYGNVDIDADLGNVELYIDGKKELYNYKVSCDLGILKIDDKNQSKELEINNKSKNNIKVKCDAGNVELDFK
jgi:DUF4097 and DUF4098 domain-containing protein YvlB